MRLLCVLLAASVIGSPWPAHADIPYDEQYRPQFHFTAKQGWLNDPNGLVYLNGNYHLFYQHNPFGTSWGNMSWGHATSPDLIHWTEHSPAIVGDPSGVKFSGTAVIDYANTAGLQTGSTPTMALFYTSVGSFDQRMAFSNDGGVTFRYYDNNPVLPSVSHADDRDPQVFWHEGSQKWVQVLWVAAHDYKPQSFSFFGSPDLKNWTYLSETPNYFECPDFFELPIDGNANNKKWVLYGASGKYQVGSFNGTSFVPDAPAAGMITQDYGANFYASQSFHNVPASDGRRIQVTWMAGANYPGMPFNQQMGFPVELTLHNTPDGVRMFRQPAAEIASLHGAEHSLNNIVFSPGTDPLGNLSGELFHIKTQIELGTASSVGFNIRGTQVRYDVATQTLSALGRSAPLAPVNGKIDLELLVDRSSLELFGGGGRISMISGFTPAPGNQAIDLFTVGGNARVVSLSAYELQSAWPSQPPAPANGLIARWKFNDPTRMAGFADAGGQNFVLSNSGVTSAVSGVAGNAIDLDNGGDYAFVPDHTGMDANSFSVSLWIKPDSTGQAAHIVGKSHYSLPGAWGLERQSDGRLKFFVQTDNGQTTAVQSQQVINTSAWHHAVASYDADLGRLELFVDGALSAASEDEVSGPIKFDYAPFMVGRRLVGGQTLDAMDGKIDELQLYDSPLKPGEIDFLRNHPGLAVEPSTYAVGAMKLQVNVDTGAVTLVNGGTAATSFKGYSILSNRAGLNASGWQSLDDRTEPTFAGWQEANPTPSALSEINTTGSYTIGPSAFLNLGNPVSAFPTPKFGTTVRNTEFAMEYIASDGEVYHGNVEFVGARAANNLVLTINPSNGGVTLGNNSTYTVTLLGYTIASESGSLRPANGRWSSLTDQGHAGIEEANASTTNLSELIPMIANAIVLAPGQTFSLGTAFNVGGSHDLALEFFLAAEPLAGDFNGDHAVDAADYVAWRIGFGSTYTEADYDTWRNNFGKKTTPVSKIFSGDVSYQSLAATSALVPEPTSAAMLATIVALQFVGWSRRCGRARANRFPVQNRTA